MLKRNIEFIEALLDTCPSCGSDNICNEDAPDDYGLFITCHDCSHQYYDTDRAEKEKLVVELKTLKQFDVASEIEDMSEQEYKDFLTENFNLAHLNQ